MTREHQRGGRTRRRVVRPADHEYDRTADRPAETERAAFPRAADADGERLVQLDDESPDAAEHTGGSFTEADWRAEMPPHWGK